MKRSVFVASVYLGLLASGASAAEVSVTGTATQSVDASNNYFLSNSPSGYTVKPLSRIDLGFLAATPITTYRLDTNYSYYKYLGPGAKDTSLTWGTPMGTKFNIDTIQPLGKFNFNASWSRSDLATTVLQQTGSFAGRGTIDTYTVGGGLKRELTKLDSLSWNANVTKATYSDPAQSPYFDYATSGAWTHRLSPTTSLVGSLNVDWLMVNNAVDSQRLFWNPQVGLQSQLTKLLNVSGNVGYDYVNAWQHGSAQPFIPGTFQQQTGASSGWVGNAVINYKILKSTQISLTVSRAITPTVLGDLQHIESISSTLIHTINQVSTLSLLAQFSHLTSGTATSVSPTSNVADAFSASATYGYKLAREWRASLSYRYNQRHDQSGLVNSSTISVALMRDFNLYGKPPQAVQKTQSELALEDLARAQQALPALTGVDIFP